ncbi:thioredoxin domain-containing protein [Nitratireductor sp. CAU 1489]|uniref:Thioredoxin domain-containing protein n=1 Tax=Nitratireductor arenosus TaxID=2682096 RepID=A0A844Q7D7_9HYPH|nr:DsbA family protein [Nitratireductor arenosus]MVA95986.1 thioredoxin domain-containing protein [Nitratireductor arenosus]
MISRRSLLGGAAAAFMWPVQRSRAAPTLDEVVFDPALPVLGNQAGDVTIAEFFDYLCPSCKALHPQLKEIVQSDGAIRLVMKDWPINGDIAWYASRMVHASAALGAYPAVHDAVMALDGPLTHGRIDDALRSAGADAGAVRDMLDQRLGAIDALIARNRTHAEAFALAGTPAFLIGRRLYRRALGADEIVAAVALARKDQAG